MYYLELHEALVHLRDEVNAQTAKDRNSLKYTVNLFDGTPSVGSESSPILAIPHWCRGSQVRCTVIYDPRYTIQINLSNPVGIKMSNS